MITKISIIGRRITDRTCFFFNNNIQIIFLDETRSSTRDSFGERSSMVSPYHYLSKMDLILEYQ